MPTIEISHVDYYKDPDDNYQSTLFTSEGYDGEADYSYIALRSINMANPDGLYSEQFQHDYRLMCFEMQDYYTVDVTYGSYEGPVGTSFRLETTFNDTSIDIVNSIIESYRNMLLGDFADYYTAAADHCAYNNMEGYFNSYFTTEMNNRYASNPSIEAEKTIGNVLGKDHVEHHCVVSSILAPGDKIPSRPCAFWHSKPAFSRVAVHVPEPKFI